MEKWKEKLQHLQATGPLERLFKDHDILRGSVPEVLSDILEHPAEQHRLAPGDGYSSLVPTIQRMIKGILASE